MNRQWMAKLSLMALALLVTACANHTSVRQHQDFESAARDINSVVIAPPQTAVHRIVFDGDNERLADKETEMSTQVYELTKTQLHAQGLEVVEFDFAQAIQDDEEFAFAVTQCREAWLAAKAELYKTGLVSEEKKSDFKTSLGPVVNVIAERTGAESLLLIDYAGFEKSSGVIAKDMAASVMIALLTGSVPVQPMEGSSIDVALVDTHSGNVLWSNRKALQVLSAQVAEAAFVEFPDMQWASEVAVASPEAVTLNQEADTSAVPADAEVVAEAEALPESPSE